MRLERMRRNHGRRVTALALGAGVAAYVAWRLVRAWQAEQGRQAEGPAHEELDVVDLASDDSFPASDPPSHTVTTGPSGGISNGAMGE